MTVDEKRAARKARQEVAQGTETPATGGAQPLDSDSDKAKQEADAKPEFKRKETDLIPVSDDKGNVIAGLFQHSITDKLVERLGRGKAGEKAEREPREKIVTWTELQVKSPDGIMPALSAFYADEKTLLEAINELLAESAQARERTAAFKLQGVIDQMVAMLVGSGNHTEAEAVAIAREAFKTLLAKETAAEPKE